MDENHQDKTESTLTTTEDKSQLPLFSPEEEKEAQKELDHLRKRLRKDRKKANQPLIVVGISAALVGVMVLIYYAWFRWFHWPWWVLISQIPYISVPMILILLIGIMLLIFLIRVGYTAQWTGFKGKTLWDWLQILGVLAIPLGVALATILFSMHQESLAQQQYNADQQRALDQQQAAILQTYIDNIQDLLLKSPLPKSKPTDNVAILARARTLTALQGLDPHRKGVLLNFLYEVHLIGYYDFSTHLNPIINLSHADLSGADLSIAPMTDADLIGADLIGTDLNHAHLSGADLRWADLSWAHLIGADLIGTDLNHAHLIGADLIGTDLNHAHLSGADLSQANLKDATGITTEELEKEAKSLQGATMPDGSTHP